MVYPRLHGDDNDFYARSYPAIHAMNYFDQVFFQKYLRENEELIFVCHRHPILIVDRVVVTLFA